MEVSIQIFSGNFLKKPVSFELVEKKLLSVLPRLPVTKVFMGWSLDKSLYEKTAEFLAQRNIDFYLWFPVFSETGAMKDLSHLVDIHERQLKSPRGADFSFFCPNSQNIKKILSIFDREFSSIKFKGIFLDRIRYPSFGNSYGLNGVFSCFCPSCCKVFERENFHMEKFKIALSASESSPLNVVQYNGNGSYKFEDSILHDFFRVKSDIIYKKLQQICMFFRSRNFSIGLDVFAPFLSPFVGQDLEKLSCLCDFIKPMMYRITNAPAGMPYETNSLFLQAGYTDAQKQKFYKMLGIKTTDKNMPFALDFAVNELQNMTKICACPVYAGVEINRVKNIAETDPSYIEETLRAYRQTDISGLSLSWNLLDMPEDNINKAAEVIRPYG